MRNSSPHLRTRLTVAAAAALPIALAAGSAQAGPGISVSTTGSTVSVTTSACAQLNGRWGTASLLSSGQSSFAQGRQAALSGTNASQSATWSDVSPGTYNVIVMCSNNSTAGNQSVVVSASSTPTASPTASRTTSPSPSPSRGVMGGIGGAARDYGTFTLVGGGLLVGSGVLATAWYLRRRQKPYRF